MLQDKDLVDYSDPAKTSSATNQNATRSANGSPIISDLAPVEVEAQVPNIHSGMQIRCDIFKDRRTARAQISAHVSDFKHGNGIEIVSIKC